jgi:hypothetical protein
VKSSGLFCVYLLSVLLRLFFRGWSWLGLGFCRRFSSSLGRRLQRRAKLACPESLGGVGPVARVFAGIGIGFGHEIELPSVFRIEMIFGVCLYPTLKEQLAISNWQLAFVSKLHSSIEDGLESPPAPCWQLTSTYPARSFCSSILV